MAPSYEAAINTPTNAADILDKDDQRSQNTLQESELAADTEKQAPWQPPAQSPWGTADPPPDGGFAAWSVVLGAWCAYFCTFGWINSMFILMFTLFLISVLEKGRRKWLVARYVLMGAQVLERSRLIMRQRC